MIDAPWLHVPPFPWPAVLGLIATGIYLGVVGTLAVLGALQVWWFGRDVVRLSKRRPRLPLPGERRRWAA